MKKICLVMCLAMIFLFTAHSVAVAMELKLIDKESPGVWGVENVSLRKYIPKIGGIKVCKTEKKVIVGFELSDDNISFYSETFPNGKRKPLGFEIDIYDRSGVFHRDNIVRISSTFSKSEMYEDNYMLDNDDKLYTLGINNPARLGVGWHYVTFQFSKCSDVPLATFEVVVQLVGNVRAIMKESPDIYNKYTARVKAQFAGWFATGGLVDSDGNNFFCLGISRQMFSRKNFFGWPEGDDIGYDRVAWKVGEEGERVSYKPYKCSFGSDPWEDEEAGGGNSGSGSGGGNSGGSSGGNSGGSSGSGSPPSSQSPADITIRSFEIKQPNINNYQHSIGVTMEYGSSISIVGELKVKNKGETEAKNVDSDYRVEDKKDFDSQDTKIDEDKSFNIKPGETVTKEMRPILITLANDGKSVTVKGGNSKTFPITGNYKELYFFADVEVPKGDKDISSSSNSTEYGVVRITTKVPNYPPKGFVDGYSCSGFNGWASDANTSNPIFVDVYVADQNNTNRRLLTRLTANQPRSDVGNHGWYLSVPQNLKDGLPHFFQFFAINHPEGNNLLLAHNSNPNLTTFQLICAPAFGSTKPTYRFYNPDYAFRSHFFTIREAEKNQLLSTGWQAEGIGWYAYEQKEANTVPVYRFFHNRNGLGHFYTASQTEKDQLSNQAEWTYEGIAFYAYTYQHYGTVPVYRFYSNEKQSHFYTTSTWEKDNAPTWGYHYEGIAFYVLPMDYR